MSPLLSDILAACLLIVPVAKIAIALFFTSEWIILFPAYVNKILIASLLAGALGALGVSMSLFGGSGFIFPTILWAVLFGISDVVLKGTLSLYIILRAMGIARAGRFRREVRRTR